MKRVILAQRLPHLLLGGIITGLLVLSSVVLFAPPAHAANQYLIDYSISEDLSFKGSYYVGKKKELSKEYGTEDSNKICEKLKSERQQSDKIREQEKKGFGIINRKVDNCRFQGSLFFIDISGKYDEKLLKKATSESGLKIKNKNELEFTTYIPYSWHSNDLEKIAKKENIGIVQNTFPGKIKSVTPNIGKISGNTWTLDKPLTSEEWDKLERSDRKVTFTAERYGSKLWLILGITIPAVLIIAAVIVLLIVRSKRKKKQQNLPPYPTGSSTYPPPPFMPVNSANPAQSQVPGYPIPGAPGMPGTTPPAMGVTQPPLPDAAGTPPGQLPMPSGAQSPISGASTQGGYPSPYGYFPPMPYPSNAPQGQPGAPTPGGNYPYPYPPANPQNPAGGQPPAPNQGYGAPTPGFLPSQPPQPGEPGATEAS